MKKQSELKTLKDIIHLVVREEGMSDYEAVDYLTLKAEAIKWVKELNTPNNENYYGTVEDWIKHFFNITEEELK